MGAGFPVSEDQLARWHRRGLLPRPSQRPLGRGRGTITIYPPGSGMQLVALCEVRRHVRSLEMAGFQLWWDGFDVDVELVRPVLRTASEELDNSILVGDSDSEIDVSPRSPLAATMNRRLGRQRVHEMAELARASSRDNEPVRLPPPPDGDDLEDLLISLDEMPEGTARLAGRALGMVSATRLINEASEAELLVARDRAKGMLQFFRTWARPFAWLFGRRAEAFQLVVDAEAHMGLEDCAEFVVGFVVLSHVLPAETMSFLSDPPEPPPVLRFLQAVMAIRNDVDGATAVFTPQAVRALLRDKEASRKRHAPKIERFIAEHREQVHKAVTSIDLGANSE